MTLPTALGGEPLAWRLDRTTFAGSWDSGEGAFRAGGRWNSRGVRAVYCSLDPATAILEVAVHVGFRTLDAVAHVLTSIRLTDPAAVHVVMPETVPDPAWLRPGLPTADQQAFGDGLLARHKLVALPSVVSSHSWNLVFVAANASGAYEVLSQEPFVLDPRLHGAS